MQQAELKNAPTTPVGLILVTLTMLTFKAVLLLILYG